VKARIASLNGPRPIWCASLEENDHPGATANWLPSAAVIQQSSDKLRAVIPIGTTNKFYRLRCDR